MMHISFLSRKGQLYLIIDSFTKRKRWGFHLVLLSRFNTKLFLQLFDFLFFFTDVLHNVRTFSFVSVRSDEENLNLSPSWFFLWTFPSLHVIICIRGVGDVSFLTSKSFRFQRQEQYGGSIIIVYTKPFFPLSRISFTAFSKGQAM